MKEIRKVLGAKSFNYKKALELYYAHAIGNRKVFPKKPNESDIVRLKLELQGILDIRRNPAESMEYPEMVTKVAELELETKSQKKVDLFAALFNYFEENE